MFEIDIKINMQTTEQMEKEILENLLKAHTHDWTKAKDSTNDLVCKICGIRTKQGVMYLDQ